MKLNLIYSNLKENDQRLDHMFDAQIGDQINGTIDTYIYEYLFDPLEVLDEIKHEFIFVQLKNHLNQIIFGGLTSMNRKILFGK